jgi:hypothetical protein
MFALTASSLKALLCVEYGRLEADLFTATAVVVATRRESNMFGAGAIVLGAPWQEWVPFLAHEGSRNWQI